MILLPDSHDKILQILRNETKDLNRKITSLHDSFMNSLTAKEQNTESILNKVILLSTAYDTILTDLSQICSNLCLDDISQFVVKMHLQTMEILKWTITNFTKMKNVVIEQDKKQVVKHDKKLEDFYGFKQSSLFCADGISYQLNKLTKQLKDQQQQYSKQINRILHNKQRVQKIEPSNSQQIIYQALEVIQSHGYFFDKINKMNQDYVRQNVHEYDVKPYSKIKKQVDQALKIKIKDSVCKLTSTLNKYLNNEHEIVQEKQMTSFCNASVQVNLFKAIQQKYIKQDKVKSNQLQQAIKQMNFEKTRAQKLQELLHKKTNFYEQKLSKSRLQVNVKKNQIQSLKKYNLENNSELKLQQIQQVKIFNNRISLDCQIEQQKRMKKIVKFNKTPGDERWGNNQKKCLDQEIAYQRSLLRIKFEDEDYSSYSSRQQKILSLCQKQVNIDFKVYYENKKFCKIGTKDNLKFCSNVLFVNCVSSPHFSTPNRNLSFLTIRHIKNTTPRDERNSCGRSSPHKSQYFNELKDKQNIKSYKTRRDRKQMTDIYAFDEIQPAPLLKKGTKEKKEARNAMVKPTDKLDHAKNSFECLNMDDTGDIYLKNNRRLNTMVSELKKRRFNQASVNTQQNPREHVFDPSCLLELYKTQQNAMQAQIEYSICASSMLIRSRKQVKDTNKEQNKNIVEDEFVQDLSKKILKALYLHRKNSNKYYLELCKYLRFPHSLLKGNIISKQKLQQDMSIKQIQCFTKTIRRIHSKCYQRFCQHFQKFLNKIGIKIE